jgi:hypothetical protein
VPTAHTLGIWLDAHFKMLRGYLILIKIRINVYFTLPERLGRKYRETVLRDDVTIADLLDKLPELKKNIILENMRRKGLHQL